MSNSNLVKISHKITSVSLVKPNEKTEVEIQNVHEKMARPDIIEGVTYKIRNPLVDLSFYLTINHVVLNKGTPHEQKQPFEIFINGKDMENFQWIVAFTRLISAVFRKGGNILFVLEELKSVVDPYGGFFHKGRRVPSLVALIGLTIEEHFKTLGLLDGETVDLNQQAFIEQKKEAFVAAGGSMASAKICKKCNEQAVIVMDGCPTCTACGDSRCG